MVVTMKNGVLWNVMPYGPWFLHEPRGVTSQKTPFFIVCICCTEQQHETCHGVMNTQRLMKTDHQHSGSHAMC
jgi:hypothetical protein